MISSQPRLDKRSEQRRDAGTYSFLVKIHKEKKKKKERERENDTVPNTGQS